VLDIAVIQLKTQTENSSLLENDIFDVYFYLWRDGTGLEEPKEYLHGLLSSPESLISLIRAYLDRSTLAYNKQVVIDIEGQEQTGLRLGLLEDFDLLNEATDIVSELLAADYPRKGQDDQTLVEALERYLNYKRDQSNHSDNRARSLEE
jgi:hypothetical protein